MDVQGSTNDLLRLVLSWDYFELLKKLEDTATRELQLVPDTFDSIEHYRTVFEPLILEECSGGIARGSVEGETPDCHESVIAYRKSDGEWLFVMMTLRAGVSEEFKKGDLIILSRDHPDGMEVRSELHALGFVESREGEQSIGVRLYLNIAAQAGMEAQENRVKIMDKEVLPKSQWWICSLGSISTIVREWVAVQHIHCIPFKNLLFTGTSQDQTRKKKTEVKSSMGERIKAQYNESQVDALYAGLDQTPLILIQGPPGTGKTHAILGLLSVILQCPHQEQATSEDDDTPPNQEAFATSLFDLWTRQAPWTIGETCIRDQMLANWVDDEDTDSGGDCYGLLDFDTPIVIGKKTLETPRVLVCAPSNSALDEIMHRIMTLGLMDKKEGPYRPTLVRVGVNVHHSVSGISIDRLIDQKLTEQGGTTSSNAEKDKIRVKLLEEADIVGSTLGYSGSSIFHRLNRKFDVVVIDEAAQAVEPTTLVPLMHGAKQVYLVGDPNQLPATVLSARASEYSYSKSLFKRLMNAGYPVHMMNMQYRMHPAISAFPSTEFYGGKLLDAPSVIEDTKSHWHCRPYFGPFVFYHVVGNEHIPEKTTSISNRTEADLIMLLYRDLIQLHPELKTQPRVAVITPYSAQVKLIRGMMKELFGPQIATMVDVNSIDGFQGRQTDIIFYSTVRSTEHRKIGFVADEHRLNVGLTRARCSLIIVGNAKSLMRDQRWARLIFTTKTNNCFYCPSHPFGVYVSSLSKGEEHPIPATAEEMDSLDKMQKGEIEDTSTLSLSLPHDDRVEERAHVATRGQGRRGRRAIRKSRGRGSSSRS